MAWLFKKLQLVSAGLYSLSHGSNDAQKTMGIIVGLLVSSQELFARQTGVLHDLYLAERQPHAILGHHVVLYRDRHGDRCWAAGGSSRRWECGITKLQPFGGFCAETGGAMTILFASHLGVPVSTTHTITGAIVGVGASKRIASVRWGVAGRIVWAWVFTIPAAALIAAFAFWIIPA